MAEVDQAPALRHAASGRCGNPKRLGQKLSSKKSLVVANKVDQNAYDLIGETPTVNEIANTLGTVLKRPVRYVEISDEQWAQAVGGRINPHAFDHLSHLWRFFRTAQIRKSENSFRVTGTIRVLTGTAPQTLEQFFRRNAEAFGGIRQTA